MALEQLLGPDWLALRVAALAAFALALLLAAALRRNNNRLAELDERFEAALADVEAELDCRRALLPHLLETVRFYVDREIELPVARANADALAASGPEERLVAETRLGDAIYGLLQTAGRHPQLNACERFRELRQQLVGIDNRVAGARRFAAVIAEGHDRRLRRFPSNLAAKLQNRRERALFSAREEPAAVDGPFGFRF